jgi:hypothetical protein
LRRELRSFAASRLASMSSRALCSHASIGEEATVDYPALNQALGEAFAGLRQQLLQVFGIVYIDRDAGQLQYDAGFSRSLGGCEMWFEAVIAKAKGK